MRFDCARFCAGAPAEKLQREDWMTTPMGRPFGATQSAKDKAEQEAEEERKRKV